MSPASTVRTGPLEFGLWMSIPALARHHRVPARTLQRWVKQERLRSVGRVGVKGVLVWSEDVAELLRMQRDTPKRRLPKITKASLSPDTLSA